MTWVALELVVHCASQIFRMKRLMLLPIRMGCAESAGSLMAWQRGQRSARLPNESEEQINPDCLWFQKPAVTCHALLLVCGWVIIVNDDREP